MSFAGIGWERLMSNAGIPEIHPFFRAKPNSADRHLY